MTKFKVWVEPFVIDIDNPLDPDDIHDEAYSRLKEEIKNGDYRCVRLD